MLKYTVKRDFFAALGGDPDHAVYAPGKDGQSDMPIAVFAKLSDAREFAKWKTAQINKRKTR